MSRPTPRPPISRLHRRLDQWVRASRRDKTWRWQRFERLLRDPGVDLNQVDQYGLYLLETLTEGLDCAAWDHECASSPSMVAVVADLIDRGVNPLLHTSLNLEVVPQQIRDVMLLALIKREDEGRGMRDDQGGNALHVMVIEARWLGEGLRGAPLHHSWLTQSRADGLNPAQALWLCPQSRPAIWRTHQDSHQTVARLVGQGVVWSVMRDLLDLEVDLDIAPPDGCSLLDTIAGFIDDGYGASLPWPEGGDACGLLAAQERILSARAGRALDVDTPKVALSAAVGRL